MLKNTKQTLIIVPEVYLMDCKDFLNTFEENSIDLLYTDPPYMTDIPEGKIGEFTKSWLNLAIKRPKNQANAYIFRCLSNGNSSIFECVIKSG
jgi:DNA modification methylase